MIGIWQLVLIFAIILVLFGAGKIPKIMKDIGSGLRAFKDGIEGQTGKIKEVDPEIEIKREVIKNKKRVLTNGNKKKTVKTTDRNKTKPKQTKQKISKSGNNKPTKANSNKKISKKTKK